MLWEGEPGGDGGGGRTGDSAPGSILRFCRASLGLTRRIDQGPGSPAASRFYEQWRGMLLVTAWAGESSSLSSGLSACLKYILSSLYKPFSPRYQFSVFHHLNALEFRMYMTEVAVFKSPDIDFVSFPFRNNFRKDQRVSLFLQSSEMRSSEGNSSWLLESCLVVEVEGMLISLQSCLPF